MSVLQKAQRFEDGIVGGGIAPLIHNSDTRLR